MTNPEHICPECQPEKFPKCTLLVFGKMGFDGKKQPCGLPAVHSTNLGDFCERCWKWVLQDKFGQNMSNDLQDILDRKRTDGVTIKKSNDGHITMYTIKGDKHD